MIIVANPGTHPEMMRIASSLITEGVDIKYLTSSSWATDSRIQRLVVLDRFSRFPIAKDLARRNLPQPIRSRDVVGLARGHEAVVQLKMRANVGGSSKALTSRNRQFQKRALRYVRRRARSVDCIVGQYTAALGIFEGVSDGIAKVLNYPIAHHRWLMATMQREAAVNPEWRHLLQGHNFSREQMENLDREIELADCVLVPSSFAMRTFVESGVPAEKIRMVPLGCAGPEEFSLGKNCHIEERGHSGLRVIYAGQVTQRKGISYLLEALQGLDGVRLQVVGPASEGAQNALKQYDNVEYLASRPRADLYQLMRDADVLALPSLAEGFGLVALEAMANGTPCILSRNTFANDLIEDGHNGFILDGVSTQSVRDTLSRLLRNPESLAPVAEAAIRTAREYSWHRYETRVAQEVLRVAAEGWGYQTNAAPGV